LIGKFTPNHYQFLQQKKKQDTCTTITKIVVWFCNAQIKLIDR